MTGFGRGTAPLSGGAVVVEIRSLNHRYLDVHARVSSDLAEHATWVEQMVRQQVARGRYDISVRVEGSVAPQPRMVLSHARALHAQMNELAKELGVSPPQGLEWLTALPELMERPSLADAEEARSALSEATKSALAALDAMRGAEGRSMETDLRERVSSVRVLIDRIRARAPEMSQEYRGRLQNRLAKLLSGQHAALDPTRLELEVALLADKSDVSEELVRLDSHFEQFDSFVASADAVGRRLDFLLQEIGREVNTIGSKCQDIAVAHTVVELKAEVERLREQVQNVE
ncbi:MAG TPA: YicC family protein [Polyangiaceae bacterium]|nr:YicC family protein [Polyangiaceae bacterium]